MNYTRMLISGGLNAFIAMAGGFIALLTNLPEGGTYHDISSTALITLAVASLLNFAKDVQSQFGLSPKE